MMNSTVRFVLLAAAISGVIARSNEVRTDILTPNSNPKFGRALHAPLVQKPVPATLEHIPAPDGQRRHLLAESTCILYRKCVTYGPTERQPHGYHEDSWVCKLSREDSNVTNGVQFVDIVESISLRDTIANSTSGAALMTVSEAIIDAEEPRMYIPDHAHVHIHDNVVGTDRIRPGEREADRGLVDHGDRKLADTNFISNNRKLFQTTGTLKTLVIRLIDSHGRQPTDNAAAMVDNVFEDDVNLKTQMATCSYNKLNIEAFHGNTPNNVYVNNGVVDVNFDYDMTSGNNGHDQIAIAAANAHLGSLDDPMFDLVMFCFPAGGNFLAFAYPNSKYSFYSNEWCGFVGGQMHEVGHNLDLAHSGEPDQGEYGDATGYMGGSSSADDYKQCFNPQKSYQLGWYEDQVATINPLDGQGRQEYTLNGVDDYGRNSGNLIVLRLRQTSLDQDYYIGYNKATGMNQDSGEDRDHVTVVRKEYGAPDQYGQSTKVAGLSPGQRVLITDYNGSGQTVQVAFTGITDEGDAHVVIMEGDYEVTNESDNCQPFTVEVVTDAYPGDNHWYFSDTGGYGYVAAISVSFDSKNTEYRQEVCLPRGPDDRTWKFSIHDAYGDGITGSGGYRVFDQNNQQLFEGGDDFSSENNWVHKYVEVAGDSNIQPTPPPTRAPTSAPTATPACREYTVEVRTDRYPGDSSWKFVKHNHLGDQIVHAQSSAYTEKSSSTFVDVCIHQGTEYEFQFFDAYADGLCCGGEADRGYYKVSDKCSGDVLIDSGEVDESFARQDHTISVPSSGCGTTNPGPSPTAPPTSSPTKKKKCKNSTKKKFKLKKGGKKRSCKSWAKKNKCDVIIEGGKNDGELVEDVCEKSCKAC